MSMFMGEYVEVGKDTPVNIIIDEIIRNATIYSVIFNRETGGLDLAAFKDEWERGTKGRRSLTAKVKRIELYWQIAYHPVISPYTLINPSLRSVSVETKRVKKIEQLTFVSMGTVRDMHVSLDSRISFEFDGKPTFSTHKLFTVYDLIRGVLLTLCVYGTPEERENKLLEIDKNMYIKADYTTAELKSMGV